ncbi:MAG: hypothetical protein AABZ55_01315 [Bdellovibrionota bacterium]
MNSRIFKFGLLILAVSISGCGGVAYDKKSTLGNFNSFANQPPASGGVPLPIPTPAPTTTPSPSPILKGYPPITMRVDGTGFTTTTVTVYTNSILKLTFSPGTQDRTIAGTGQVATYSKMGVYIGIGSNLSPTEMLNNGFTGGTPQTSRVFDLSSSFTKTCAAGDSACRQAVTIKIGNPSNDFYCLNFGSYCPWGTLYSTHPWNGTLRVQTDDTDSL